MNQLRTVPTVDVAVAAQAGSDTQLLDVREPAEWIHGHIAGTVNVPLGRLHLHLDELDRQRPVICICRSGNRSGTATALLVGAGYDATNMAGGTAAWAASGRPLVDRHGRPGVLA